MAITQLLLRTSGRIHLLFLSALPRMSSQKGWGVPEVSLSSTCVAFSFDTIAASKEEMLKPSVAMVLYRLLIRYRDEEVFVRGGLGGGGAAS